MESLFTAWALLCEDDNLRRHHDNAPHALGVPMLFLTRDEAIAAAKELDRVVVVSVNGEYIIRGANSDLRNKQVVSETTAE